MQRSNHDHASPSLLQWLRNLLIDHAATGTPLPENRVLAQMSGRWSLGSIEHAMGLLKKQEGIACIMRGASRFVVLPAHIEKHEAACKFCTLSYRHVDMLFPSSRGGKVCNLCCIAIAEAEPQAVRSRRPVVAIPERRAA
jgi:hypothetical protein